MKFSAIQSVAPQAAALEGGVYNRAGPSIATLGPTLVPEKTVFSQNVKWQFASIQILDFLWNQIHAQSNPGACRD